MTARRVAPALLALLCAGVPSPAGTRAEAPPKLAVAAAADLRLALDEIIASLRRSDPSFDAAVTYGSSGQLYAQIVAGAPFDVFFSADATYPRRLAADGRALAASERPYAVGRLVLWVPRASRLEIERHGLDALADPSVRRVAVANPAHAPYGRAAQAALEKLGLWQRVAPKLVMGESVAQAAQFAESGNADAALIPLSLALAPALASGRHVEVPPDSHPPIEQEAVVLSGTHAREQAARLLAFVTGPDGRALLARHGFLPPPR